MDGSSVHLVVMGGGNPADFERVLSELPTRMTLAVLVHCTGDTQILHALQFPVEPVKGTAKIEAGRVYIVPPNARVEIRDRSLAVQPKHEANNTLDTLLRSAADAYGAQTVGVILGGHGSAGVLGIKRIKEVGGITIAQAGATGQDVEMPRSAVAGGVIDLVLTASEIASRLQHMGDHRQSEERPGDTSVDMLRDILTLVRIRSGHDFAAYKRATLFRRISRRMQVCQTGSIAEYHQYLREHPNELSNLLRDFLISVTNFFRDPDAFETLAKDFIPKLFANKGPSEQVRVWVPGCASGEEVYSLAILLAEYAQQTNAPQPIQLFATDIDEESLAEARNARYPESISVDVGQTRLDRFFTRENGYYRLNKDLREMVLFSPHNLLRDPPFSRLDLISCRNLLIYLNREAQDRVLNLFHFGIRPDGYLFLGSSESAENTSMFSALDPKYRIYQRRTSTAVHGLDALVATGRWHAPVLPTTPPVAQTGERALTLGELHFRVVEQYAPPSVLVNQELDVIHISENAGKYLTIAGGEPTKALLRMAIPPLRLDLRTAIYAARQPGRTTDSRVVRFDDGGEVRTVEIRVVANKLEDVAPGTLLVMFEEKPESEAPAGESESVSTMMEPVVREIEDELRRTRDQLRSTIEQYETSLEELKASNEELQAINEELRSATEELETSKEELQSVNEELTTLNHELKVKVDEVSHANSDLQNLMSSTDIGVLFLDRQLNIKRFTPRAQALFNVIPTDIGRPVAHLTHKLETSDLPEQAQTVVQTLRTIEREVSSKDARRYLMRLLPYRSLDDRIDGVVVTFVDVTDLRAAERALVASEERLYKMLRSLPVMILSLGQDGRAASGFLEGKELSAEATLRLFSKEHAEELARIARDVLTSRAGQRVELDVNVDGHPHRFVFRLEPTARGLVDVVGFELTSGASDRT
jgi:two-component system CheB/CheR fusion protein